MNNFSPLSLSRAALLLAATRWLVQTPLLADQPENITKVIHIRHGTPSRLRDLTGNSSPVHITADDVLKVLVLGGRPENIAATELLIQELDQPSKSKTEGKNIELTVYAIGANSKPLVAAEQPIPTALDSVIKQIRAVFPYRTFQLLTSSFTRSRIGEQSNNQGFFAVGDDKSSYDQGFVHSDINAGNGQPSIHLSKFHFIGRVNLDGGRHDDFEVSTDLDLRENQKVVVGKAGTGSDDSAIFIVLTAKVVD